MRAMLTSKTTDHSRCWARMLGDCAGGMTGEHSISRNQFNQRKIIVDGYPWCLGKPKTVGIGSLVARVLCKHHNNALSPLDEAAADVLRALETMADRAAGQARGRRSPRQIVRLSGD